VSEAESMTRKEQIWIESNDGGMTKSELQKQVRSAYPFEHSGFIRHSSFGVRHYYSCLFVCFVGKRIFKLLGFN